MDELLSTNCLPFVVQYRRKDGGIRWADMAAFDLLGPAERYRDTCAGDNVPWEYRVDDRSPALSNSERTDG